MKILITGGSSLLGKALIETAPPSAEVSATWYTNYVGESMYQMDVCNPSQIAYVFDKVKPKLVIHCGIITSVDYAETHYQESWQVCVKGTRNVYEACKRTEARFVFPSTNAVFGGDKPPYKEDDARKPVNRYGSMRRQAEDQITSDVNWLILRLFLMFGWPWPRARQNWVTMAIDRLGAGQPMRIVNDTWYQPAYAQDVARVVWALSMVVKDDTIYHIAPEEKMTLYDLIVATAKEFGLNESLIEPVPSSTFPNIAPRPTDSTYDVDKLHKLGLKVPNAVEGLARMAKVNR